MFRQTRPGEMASFEATVANITFGVDETQMIPMQGEESELERHVFVKKTIRKYVKITYKW